MRRLLTGQTVLDRALGLHDQVALRPEPFGALAYHYGTRRLVFVKHPDLVTVVRSLADHESVRAALTACAVAETRWPAFCSALSSLLESEMLHDRNVENDHPHDHDHDHDHDHAVADTTR